MTFIYNNGDVNVVLITLICTISIVVFFIFISMFSRIGKKEEEDELESYYEEYDDVDLSLVNVKVKPRSSNVSRVKKVSKSKKTSTKPILKVVDELTEIKVIKPKVIKPKVIKPKSKTIELVKDDESIELNTKEKVTDEKVTDEKVTELVTNSIVEEKFVETDIEPVSKPNQSSIKINKVGSIQVDDRIKLNEAEKRMLSSVLTSNDRGHIIQLVSGSKIMDFKIDSLAQLNHIEKQIERFSDSSGNYVVYIVWESNLKYRVSLTQKLRYNPNVRYK